ncbi:hypothetical protein H0261_03125 [Pectobacterium versatile]|uniref:hypothetical protein n=1 Tax=Pectobacterium TaxID=122277 RepID=UPI0013FD8995|nr:MULTISPECIES: hypothetical protein [Pectobacterium]MBA0182723.1 hypothetical protein [Pectobacterium versatile]MBD0848900.1 hypothetical protein [Pectobacterium carotovorum subsp. carotovorum]MBK4825931.1 hypothetical protein [Pectobacterium carotovorum subsp. carotovorum]QUI37590.1 hypothetical protein IMY97_13465 [Pectobacterium versatile]GKW34870.1 hypothetical protein PEC730217_36500 [Pectobacterium carotovorum subsp. carotovorum]
MSSVAFILCLIFAAVMVLVHPAFSVPFIIGACLITGKCRMHLDSNTSIILGITGFLLLLTLAMCIRSWLK